MSSLRFLSPFLPALTALIGLGGFIVGIYSFTAPISAAQIYGVQLPANTATRSFPSKKSDEPAAVDRNNSQHVAYIYAHGIRNFAIGLAIMGLTAYWQCQTSLAAQSTAQRCLGIVIMAGSLTPVVDAVVVWQAAQKDKAVDMETGRKAARLHALRSLAWLATGLWCLFG
ncbi:hypothetical protein A1O1_07197 [Capronia coronata CBS 617.96]|uniref:Uncharacterized protein n=1 Tax=Capronia coronata CBS 617.96 TaxID=1182541 RepID=W9YMS6_9EURO|nr:uncharacterized protein A1O1_07197 [Capronia coronata CBS 617.96]EXJ83574.1 hypothetical protein A1O1_07197 [Capronia coronata CBS 617.96]